MGDKPNERFDEYLNLIGIKAGSLKCSDISAVDGFYEYCLSNVNINVIRKICDSYYGFIDSRSDDKKYNVKVMLPKSGDIFHGEYDRCEDAFKLYMSVYSCLKEDGKILSYKINEYQSIPVSGDLDINFKTAKLQMCFDIIDKDKNYSDDEKRNLINRLIRLQDRIYTPLNISIMPVSGGMNNLKEKLGSDRIDTLIFFLKLYYENGVESCFLNFGQETPGNIELRLNLKAYLDSFDSVYDYCSTIYHIDDKNFVDKLCKNGKKAILSAKDIENYVNLSLEFWVFKQKYFEKIGGETKKIYDKMTKEHLARIGKEFIDIRSL